MHLECGWVLPLDQYPFTDDSHRHEVWERYKDQILADYRAGMRPRAWWDYEAKEPRRLLPGKSVSIDRESGESYTFTPFVQEAPERRFWTYRGCPGLLGQQINPVWETQLEYLERLGLANPGEREKTIQVAAERWIDRHKMQDSPPPMPEEEKLLKWWDEI